MTSNDGGHDGPGVMVPTDSVGAFVGQPALLARGTPDGPLAGLRVGVKDLFDVAGTVTTAGNRSFAHGRAPAQRHAAAVQLLLDAAATVVAKTVTDELAYSLAGVNQHYGTPRNVAAPGHVAGGSSSGSAAAVAAGLVELGLGTDTGGSIRVPASYCGLFSWRPTHGTVSLDGVIGLAPSFDTVGLLARSVEHLGVGAAALLGGVDAALPSDDVAVIDEAMAVIGAAERECVLDALDAVDHDPSPSEVPLGLDLAAGAEAFRVLQAREAWSMHGAWIESAQPVFAPDVAERFAAAREITDAAVRDAEALRTSWVQRLGHVFERYGVLAMAASATPAPAINASVQQVATARTATMQLTCMAGLAGLPVVVAPAGRVDGLPYGVAFIGPPNSDLALLGWLQDRLTPRG